MGRAELIIRSAAADDLGGIAEIQACCPEASQWPVEEYLLFDAAVAVADGRVTGFLISRTVAGETEILNVAVHPEYRRRGIASALLLATAGEVLFLEVRESNIGAVDLYRKLGFTVRGTRSNYYENPTEDAIVMSLSRTLGNVKFGLSRADQDKA